VPHQTSPPIFTSNPAQLGPMTHHHHHHYHHAPKPPSPSPKSPRDAPIAENVPIASATPHQSPLSTLYAPHAIHPRLHSTQRPQNPRPIGNKSAVNRGSVASYRPRGHPPEPNQISHNGSARNRDTNAVERVFSREQLSLRGHPSSL